MNLKMKARLLGILLILMAFMLASTADAVLN